MARQPRNNGFRPDKGTRPDSLTGVNERRPGESFTSLEARGGIRTPNDDRGASQDDVARILTPFVPGMGPALFIKDLLDIPSLQPTNSPQGPEGRSRQRLFRPVEEDVRSGGTSPGEADMSNVGARGRRRRRLLGTVDQPPTTRRQLLGI